ncbi:hypothetical protein JG688_00017335 [Phytophthora aleatoria]|uniref:RxLR effector protein n=1 Tax=Phytophthora aleatoria TaxID=2496075 RepID=A0A8J5I1M8_9STRA|nr:hypothetical protein JG688_00017335 [Phytophthora aleatoria]
MRAYFALLIAATTLLTNGEAATTNSGISQLAATDVVHSAGVVESDGIHRSLRVVKLTDDDDSEERTWSVIKGISRSEKETVDDWLTHRLQEGMNVQQFARDVDITSRIEATQHPNWNALATYLTMYHRAITGKEISKDMAESILLHKVLKEENGF